jgi:hypothetical protein
MALAMPFVGSGGCSCENLVATPELLFTYSPNSLDFGAVPLHTSRTLTLQIQNGGTEGIVTVSGIALQGVSSDEFEFVVDSEAAKATWETTGKINLAVGEYAVILVTYTPSNAGSDSGSILFTHNVAQQNYQTGVAITTSGQVGDLNADPYPIDFGEVEAGTTGTIDVTITNNGTFSVDVQDVYLDYEGSYDFSIVDVSSNDGATAKTLLDPGESLMVVLEYTPKEGGNDTTNLIVLGTMESTQKQWSFEVSGTELGPKINILPNQIDFGFVPVDEARTQSFTISNMGNADLIITSMGTSIGSDENIVIDDGPTPEAPIVLAPEGFQEFHTTWTAKGTQSNPEAPIGAITIASNDAMASPNILPVYGRIEAPSIEVMPTEVDFGFGAQMTPKMATITISNNGFGPLVIKSLTITDDNPTTYGKEFAVVNDPTFPVTSLTNPSDSIIDGNSFRAIKLTFTNKGPASGHASAKLIIVSNSKGQESITVTLDADRAGAPECRGQLVPYLLNFGTIAVGFPEVRESRLVNTGTGPCTVKQYRLTDCSSDMMSTGCPAALTGSASAYFKMKTPPDATPGALRAGEAMSMQIEFTPPTSTSLFNLLNKSSGLLSYKIRDESKATEYVIPECEGTCTANIVGQSGIAKAAVLPDHIDYGVVTIGCYSRTYSICVYNSGNAPLKVTKIEMKGCTPEVHMKNVPPLPKVVGTGAPVCFETNYSPVDEGVDKCSIHMSVTDKSAPVIAIPVKGEGTYETQHTDVFTQIKGDEVDILFVIDDSGSMSEEQQRLTSSFAGFISQAAVWDNDYHIGVISLNVVDEAVIGRLNRGDKSKTPRYIVKSNQAQSQFANLSNLGADGGSDEQEAGLQAAQTALAAPFTTDTEISCSTNSDCSNDPNICADPANCPYTCIEGSCGGFNKGFVREDAQLEIIILSDEEDQSSGSIAFYIDFLTNIKGWANVGRMHVNTIVGVEGVPQGGSESACVAADGGTAAEGKRYIEATTQTNGMYGSICESSFTAIMSDIADISFNPKLQFFLSRLADPATVRVTVNDIPCADGWEFDSPSNSVIFDLEGGCLPQPGDKIEVSYKMLCLKG